MLQLPHKRDLSQDALTVLQIAKDVLESLDCNFLARAAPCRQSNLPIAAYSYDLFTLVVVSNIPILKLVLLEEVEISPSAPTYSLVEFLISWWISSLVPSVLSWGLAF